MKLALESEWGRLFRNWETVTPDDQGFPDVGEEGAQLHLEGMSAFAQSFEILWTSMKEAPEISAHRRHHDISQEEFEERYYMKKHHGGPVGNQYTATVFISFIAVVAAVLLLIFGIKKKRS